VPESSKEEDLQKELNQYGLPAEKWLELFKSKLGITTVKALKYVGPEDLDRLEVEINTEWEGEKKALLKLLENHKEKEVLTTLPNEHVPHTNALRKSDVKMDIRG